MWVPGVNNLGTFGRWVVTYLRCTCLAG
jgi:hypothetical protein